MVFVFFKKIKNTAGMQILKTIDQVYSVSYEAYVVLSAFLLNQVLT